MTYQRLATDVRARNGAERVYARGAVHLAALAATLLDLGRPADAAAALAASAIARRALAAEHHDPEPAR